MLIDFTYTVPYLLTVAIAFGVALAGFVQYRLAGRVSPEARIVMVVLMIAFGALFSVVLTSRTLDEAKIADGGSVITYDDVAGGFAISRWLSLLMVAAAAVEVARGWVRARTCNMTDPAWPLLASLLAYYVGTIAIQVVASDHTGFALRNLYVPLVLIAVYYQRPRQLASGLVAAKWALLVVMVGSLAAIVLRPDFVLHKPDPGVIPWVNWRLFGLTPHANTLGPIALLAIILELHLPSRVLPLRWLNLSAAALAFVLAQSKTAWAAAPVMVAVVYLPLVLRRGYSAGGTGGRFNLTVWAMLACIFAMVVSVAAIVGFDVIDSIQRRSDLITLTGRTQIWDLTLQAWKDNVMFGYGPEIWGEERQFRFHMFHVGHAHNQVVQTLGEAGLFGLVLLLLYLGGLLYTSLRWFFISRGLPLLLLVLLLLRCVTEAPMRGEGLLTWATFLHVLLLAAACHTLRNAATHAVREPAKGLAARRHDAMRADITLRSG
jgi:exopolysaccharide production protein ExoQ